MYSDFATNDSVPFPAMDPVCNIYNPRYESFALPLLNDSKIRNVCV